MNVESILSQSPATWASLLALISTTYWLGLAIYRLTFHPLARFPGPFFAKISGFYAVYHGYVGDLHLDMHRRHEEYGTFVRYGPNKVIVNTPEAIQEIYSRTANVQKSTAYKAFETSPTAHDLQSTVDKVAHTRKRRVISQAFSNTALRTLEGHVLHHIDSFIHYLSGDEDSKKNVLSEKPQQNGWTASRNMASWCNYISFDLMAELVFGHAFSMLSSPKNRYIIDLIQFAAFRVGVCLQMPSLATYNVDKLVAPSVRRLRDRYVGTSKEMAMNRMQMEAKRQDLFSHILAARDPETGKGFSMDEIWGESTLLIVAGSDAISTGMGGCFFYLGKHVGAYEKARDEVRARFASAADIKSGPALNDCVFLRACIEESLRMSPPVGGALWREVCPGGVSIAGEHIPAGVDVGVGIYAIHHNPAYFPAPFEYSPDRWIVSEGVNAAESVAKARAAFTPFSIGPVGCVGKNLAYMELTLTMARVLFELDFEGVQEEEKGGESMDAAAGGSYLQNYPAHNKEEYHLRDRFTSWKNGPWLRFKPKAV